VDTATTTTAIKNVNIATQKRKTVSVTITTQKINTVTDSTNSNGAKSVTKSSGTGIVVYKPTKTNQTKISNDIDENAKDNTIKVGIDNTINSFPRTAEVSSDSGTLTYPVAIYVAVSIVAAFTAVFIVVGLIGYAVQRRRRRKRRESQVEELKPITSGDTLLEQWLSWRIYDTIDSNENESGDDGVAAELNR
jgi:Flp pilus assembly protein TadB